MIILLILKKKYYFQGYSIIYTLENEDGLIFKYSIQLTNIIYL